VPWCFSGKKKNRYKSTKTRNNTKKESRPGKAANSLNEDDNPVLMDTLLINLMHGVKAG
jgi:hypothetical protein